MATKISSRLTHGGTSYSDKSRFEAVYDAKPTIDELSAEQLALGYHPAGYGGPDSPRYTPLADGQVKVEWSCSGSCD